jgi:hypothetical protein
MIESMMKATNRHQKLAMVSPVVTVTGLIGAYGKFVNDAGVELGAPHDAQNF